MHITIKCNEIFKQFYRRKVYKMLLIHLNFHYVWEILVITLYADLHAFQEAGVFVSLLCICNIHNSALYKHSSYHAWTHIEAQPQQSGRWWLANQNALWVFVFRPQKRREIPAGEWTVKKWNDMSEMQQQHAPLEEWEHHQQIPLGLWKKEERQMIQCHIQPQNSSWFTNGKLTLLKIMLMTHDIMQKVLSHVR